MKWRLVVAVSAAIAGLALAAVLGYLALQLVSQPVGLSSVPQRAGDELIGPPADPVSDEPQGDQHPTDSKDEDRDHHDEDDDD
jgi:hypothetical protein